MFLPDECTVELNLPFNHEPILQIVGNRERSILIAVTASSLYVFLPNPLLLLCTYRRETAEVEERGRYKNLYWRHNSAAVCVTTDSNCLYIYSVAISAENECFNLEDENHEFRRTSSLLYLKGRRPVVDVTLSVIAKLESEPSCVTPLRDELFVCLKDGWVHRITWSGDFLKELSFHIRLIPFAFDQVGSKTETLHSTEVFITDFVYSPLIGGICMLLSDGRPALLVSSSQQFNADSLAGIWVQGAKNVTCCAANHKFRMIYFGHESGEISAYSLDDTNGSLIQVFVQKLFVKNGTQFLDQVGPVKQIECLSQGGVTAVIWEKNKAKSDARCPPVLALFSPFGAQWWTSLEDVLADSYSEDSYSCIEWGVEGHQLWLGLEKSVFVMNIVHSQPDSADRIVLLGNDKVYLSPKRCHQPKASAPQFVWPTYSVPHDYISANWPVRLVGFDPDCNKILVVVGSRGFCFYNFKTNKWRLFRKEAQEKALFVTGGVTVFEDFIVACACDTSQEAENIYIFHHEDQLDLDSAEKLRTGRVLFMNSKQNHLITFDVQCLITIFGMKSEPSGERNRLSLQRIAEIRINDLLPHPTCVVSVQLTSLNYYKDAAEFGFGMDALLVNVSGHLLMLCALNKPHPTSNDTNHFQLHPPMLIASNVERTWVQTAQRDIPHLNKALWINAGCRKMKVWLPLADLDGPRTDSRHSFISRRIMLPVETNTYPLAIDEDCLACGAEAIALLPTIPSHANESVHQLSRTSEVFMHRLLKQLLKRNLGTYALQIVSACRCLSYFGHILELLLHDVLEEEATSSEPIPEPLLPRVVSFVREFPEYLKIIVYCARKTELAIRNHLFTVAHHPRELFRMCLEEEQLETATSCLIVLQSLETAVASVEFATTLLDEALTKRKWKIARDIVRFLHSIDKKDLEDVPESPLGQKLAGKQTNKPLFLPDDDTEDYGLVYNSSSEHKTSITSPAPPRSAKPSLVSQPSFGSTTSPPSTTVPRLILNRSGSIHSPPPALPAPTTTPPPLSDMPELISTQVNEILNHHAVGLLHNFGVRDLGFFSGHLGYDLTAFFRHPSSKFHATPEQFPLILMKLHAQFNWPYPMATELVVSNGHGPIVSPSPSSISIVDETSSLSSEDVMTSPNFVMTPRINGESQQDRISRRVATDFNRKVFEKLCEKSKAKGTKQSEDEISYIQSAIAEADAIEWTLFLAILRQDVAPLSKVLQRSAQNLNKMGRFVKIARPGLGKLIEWSETSCTAYTPILEFFREFIEVSLDSRPPKAVTVELAQDALKTLDLNDPIVNGN
ncbi:unnamed protein product [Bursaphelenchus xylophilus]|uniref:Protein RIC1 homolog n=1 Tax=Bursaphelenchus xylophilus TaxID=6326 RepID=A0A1I7SVM7_BURXY|nr:unnamed protein product [Bursaphelenchus xylophilus]CAG9101663.1 unnamed protein product [Bursaphelenchus xylophilus]